MDYSGSILYESGLNRSGPLWQRTDKLKCPFGSPREQPGAHAGGERFDDAGLASSLFFTDGEYALGGLHVIDYKTGKVPENPDTFQLLQYAVILARTLTYPVTQASYLYLEGGEWRTFTIDPDDVRKTRGAVLVIAGRIARETEYREVVGSLCKYCDFLAGC